MDTRAPLSPSSSTSPKVIPSFWTLCPSPSHGFRDFASTLIPFLSCAISLFSTGSTYKTSSYYLWCGETVNATSYFSAVLQGNTLEKSALYSLPSSAYLLVSPPHSYVLSSEPCETRLQTFLFYPQVPEYASATKGVFSYISTRK